MNENIILALSDKALYGSIDTICRDTGNVPVLSNGLPLSNLITEDLWQGTQFASNDPTNTQFVLDLGAIKPISILALLKHNIEAGGHWQINIYDTLSNYIAASPLYSSDLEPVIPTFSIFGALPWGTFLWGETTSEEDLVGYNRHAYMPLESVVLGRYVSVSIYADTNSSLVSAFRFWAGTYYQPSFNPDYSSELQPIDETQIKKGFSGARSYGQVVKRRQIKAIFNTLPQAELNANIYGPIFLRNGAKKPFIYMGFPKDKSQWMTHSVYGNIPPQTASLPYVSWKEMGATITIEEAV